MSKELINKTLNHISVSSNHEAGLIPTATVILLGELIDALRDCEASQKGIWGQYSPSYGPFIKMAEEEWNKGKKWVFDTSHDVSEILPDGTRRRVGTFQHAEYAAEAEIAVNGVRSGALILAAEADAKLASLIDRLR